MQAPSLHTAACSPDMRRETLTVPRQGLQQVNRWGIWHLGACAQRPAHLELPSSKGGQCIHSLQKAWEFVEKAKKQFLWSHTECYDWRWHGPRMESVREVLLKAQERQCALASHSCGARILRSARAG